MSENIPTPSETPNVVIEDPKTRKKLNTALSILLLVIALVSMFWFIFPEAAPEGDLASRIERFITTAVLLVSAWFGLGVTNRNYPKF
ncbi:membrane protein [Microbacterium phage Mazun]|nr:membrane protein [Microbacterium phage Mazun]